MSVRQNATCTLRRVKGNLEPIGATLRDQQDAPIDLTGKTVKARMVDTATPFDVKINDQAATPDPDQVNNKGRVSYAPQAGQMDTPGVYAFYFFIDDTPKELFPYDGAKYLVHVVEEYDRTS